MASKPDLRTHLPPEGETVILRGECHVDDASGNPVHAPYVHYVKLPSKKRKKPTKTKKKSTKKTSKKR